MTALADTRPTATRSRLGGTVLTVDLRAVAANTRLFTRRTNGEVMAVVKAAGFGHGAVDVARTALASGATRLGVTTIAEALALRQAGIGAPILSWLNPLDADFGSALDASVELAVPSAAHLETIARTAPGARIHLHLDTGLARDGAAVNEWAALCSAAAGEQRQGRVDVVGVMGHLPCADSPGHPANARGQACFAGGVQVARGFGLRPAQRHLAATAATLTDPRTHHTMSRIGAGLVGIDPSGTTALRSALTLTAPLISVRAVAAGTPVGYQHRWVAAQDTYIGLLPIGYADGLPRAGADRAEVAVRGRRCRLAGPISMDMTVVDLGADGAEAGDTVTVLGPGRSGEPTVQDWAGWSGTIEHEIITGLGARLTRVVHGGVNPIDPIDPIDPVDPVDEALV